MTVSYPSDGPPTLDSRLGSSGLLLHSSSRALDTGRVGPAEPCQGRCPPLVSMDPRVGAPAVLWTGLAVGPP